MEHCEAFAIVRIKCCHSWIPMDVVCFFLFYFVWFSCVNSIRKLVLTADQERTKCVTQTTFKRNSFSVDKRI